MFSNRGIWRKPVGWKILWRKPLKRRLMSLWRAMLHSKRSKLLAYCGIHEIVKLVEITANLLTCCLEYILLVYRWYDSNHTAVKMLSTMTCLRQVPYYSKSCILIKLSVVRSTCFSHLRSPAFTFSLHLGKLCQKSIITLVLQLTPHQFDLMCPYWHTQGYY